MYTMCMARRNHNFAVGEYYHCYNRGVDKRTIFLDSKDFQYFLKALITYNSAKAIKKMRLYNQEDHEKPIVEIVAYCLLPNHFHLLLKELEPNGISKFLQKTSISYTMAFNEKYKRSGVLFQGPFKSKHIETDQDLQQVIAYITYNNIIHNINDTSLFRSTLNTDSIIVRDPYSHTSISQKNMRGIVDIIKDQRLSFDH